MAVCFGSCCCLTSEGLRWSDDNDQTFIGSSQIGIDATASYFFVDLVAWLSVGRPGRKWADQSGAIAIASLAQHRPVSRRPHASSSGAPSQPNVFYIDQVNGGVFKTTDYGRTWIPIFDDQPTGTVGSIAVAASNPNIIYVGSGEGLQRPDLSVGDGIYKSTDAGKTWIHLGLRDGQQIPQIQVGGRFPR